MRREGNKSLALTRDANLDTQSSDISADEIKESGRSFQSLIVCGKKLLLYASFFMIKQKTSALLNFCVFCGVD